MADQNDQQSPSNPTTAPTIAVPVQNPVQTDVQKVEATVEKGFTAVVKDLWAKYGILFVLIGAGIAILKFNDVIMDILGWSSKKDLKEAQKTDSELKAKEDAANNQANALVKEANELPSKEGVVDDNWDKENK